MAFVVNDRVQETTTTTGTGTIDLDGAVVGFESFVSAIGNGNDTYYAIVGGSEFEVGIGTVTDATPDTLSRTTVISSSNSDALVNFSAGTKNVFCTLPASKAALVNTSNNVIIGNSNTDTAVTTRGTGDITINTNEGTNSGTVKIFDGVNGNIEITPNGTGVVKLDGLSYPTADGTSNQFLKTNGSAVLSFATVGTPIVDPYNTGNAVVWTKPTTANWIQINVWGGGGSGGKGATNAPAGGGGGGAYNTLIVPFSYLVGNVTYTVGGGGASQTVASTVGNPGGTTFVDIANYNGSGLTKRISAFGGGAGGFNAAGGRGGGGGGINSAGGNGGTGSVASSLANTSLTTTGTSCGGFPSYYYYDDTACASAGSLPIVNPYGGGFGGAIYSVDSSATKRFPASFWYATYGGGGGGLAVDAAGTTDANAGSSDYGGGGGGGAVNSGTAGVGGTSIYGGGGSNGTTGANASSAGTLPAGGSGGTEGGDSGAGGSGRVEFIYW